MFRFTIRDVLWLMVVVAVLAAWWVDHRNLVKSWKQEIEARNEWIDEVMELRRGIYNLTGKLPISGYKASTAGPTVTPDSP